ncbi:glycosyltransferase [Salmonella enterica]|uniref:Glycosyltransferase n=1 Tax=Salmonella enterica subsp. houtenae serovar 45:g,z51:- TaxID=1967611 RepID=A0A753BGU8_SALHO|nr:glycosyltransferase [Salmonella enterica]EBP3940477.1 glycosyltransferase [Salmonella enterica subsp. enterica]HAF0295090.1 glycosyltransferase [Salmonella enterica subsp. houtenae serovar 43:z4,z32:-]EAB6271748.1 glycosyltransferase [Salmonella enterica subsp. houtenae]EAN8732858.1 glycosyltransferase [Salmonella enterica]EAR7467778.1 glycosyltransferase [Salmonella enterica]
MTDRQFSPVVMFVYAKPEHTRKTIESLAKNPEASSTDLFIYSDAAKSDKDSIAVREVRNIVSSVSGFKSVSLYFRSENIGLASNIMDGVSKVCEKYGRVIVIEDDIVTSPCFLAYMNAALEKYEDDKRIWHVTGWNYPFLDNYMSESDAYLWRMMNCWGWGTWNDRWVNFRKDPEELIKSFSKKDISEFNLDNAFNFWSQVEDNYNGKINTWAIFWYATIFKNNGLCLNPVNSMVKNIGMDGTGENCNTSDIYKTKLSYEFGYRWPNEISEDKTAINIVREFYKSNTPTLIQRIVNKVKRTLLK